MKILTIFAVLIIVSAAYAARVNTINNNQDDIQERGSQEVLSEEDQEGTSSASIEIGNEVETETEIESDQSEGDDAVDRSESDKQQQNESNLDYVYPSSQVVTSTSARIELTSNDNPDTVTDWYKERINSSGKNVTSFVTTSTNNNVLNELVGDDGNQEVRIEIRKDANEDTVHISIEVLG